MYCLLHYNKSLQFINKSAIQDKFFMVTIFYFFIFYKSILDFLKKHVCIVGK